MQAQGCWVFAAPVGSTGRSAMSSGFGEQGDNRHSLTSGRCGAATATLTNRPASMHAGLKVHSETRPPPPNTCRHPETCESDHGKFFFSPGSPQLTPTQGHQQSWHVVPKQVGVLQDGTQSIWEDQLTPVRFNDKAVTHGHMVEGTKQMQKEDSLVSLK